MFPFLLLDFKRMVVQYIVCISNGSWILIISEILLGAETLENQSIFGLVCIAEIYIGKESFIHVFATLVSSRDNTLIISWHDFNILSEDNRSSHMGLKYIP
jgi:hypothetical protein